MLEIIAIFYLAGKMGELAERKGQKKGKWKTFTVLGWIGSEIAGIVIGIAVFGSENLAPMLLVGYTFAILSYFAIRQSLQKMPDIDNRFDFEKDNPQS